MLQMNPYSSWTTCIYKFDSDSDSKRQKNLSLKIPANARSSNNEVKNKNKNSSEDTETSIAVNDKEAVLVWEVEYGFFISSELKSELSNYLFNI